MDSRVDQSVNETSSSAFLEVTTTLASLEQARTLANLLVEKHRVACVHIAAIDSVYVWQDQLCQEQEYRLSCKISASKYPEIEATIRLHHPYDLPAIYAVHLAHIQVDFAAWIFQVEDCLRSNHQN
jgi:periplasmic divalent cation tolerance protein